MVSFKFIIEDLDNFTDVEMPALLLKWVGEGREEERVETEDRLVAKRVEGQCARVCNTLFMCLCVCVGQKSQEE